MNRVPVVPLILAGALAAMLWWSWLKWPDPIVDFGLQLYFPWQILQGRALYRDLTYLNGPLSAYVNAGWFALMGVHLRSLVAGNLAILVGVLAMMVSLTRGIGDRFAAAMAGLTFLLVFAFDQFALLHANYNWVCPYSHDLTHGIALSLVALVLLRRCAAGKAGGWGWFFCGTALGAVFLTKPEVFVAAAGAVAAGVIADGWTRRWSARAWGVHTGLLAVGAVVPVGVAFALLCLAMPARTAAWGIAGAWPGALNGRVRALHYYKVCTGTDDVAGNLLRMAVWGAGYAMGLGLIVLAGWMARRARHRLLVAVLAAAGGAAAVALVATNVQRFGGKWLDSPRPLPVVVLAIFAVAAIDVFRHRGRPDDGRRVMRVALAVFALGLLGKILLHARVNHYGFALAMPAGLLTVVAAVGWAPQWVARRGGSDAAARAVACAMWAAAVGAFLTICQAAFEQRVVPVGRGADLFYADARGERLNLLLGELDRLARPGDTVAALPEITMINYLSRRRNPTPYAFVQTPEAITYGEDAIVAAYEAHPPDWFVIASDAIAGDHLRYEGDDYGWTIYPWVRSHYVQVEAIERPMPTNNDKLILYRRRAGPPPSK